MDPLSKRFYEVVAILILERGSHPWLLGWFCRAPADGTSGGLRRGNQGWAQRP